MINRIKEMARRKIWSAALGLLLMGISLPMASSSFAAEILLLADEDSVGTTALESALTTDGHVVTRVTPEYLWDGTLTGPNGPFECVVHLNGATAFDAALKPFPPLSVDAQRALENFVSSGQGGFIGSQWNGLEADGLPPFFDPNQTDMPNLVLQGFGGTGDSAADFCAGVGCDMTYTKVNGQEDHPVLAGIGLSFTFHADGHDAGPKIHTDSTILMEGWSGGPGVVVREFGNGRGVVNFSHAANFNLAEDLTLQDANIQQLYLNAVAWACTTSDVPEPGPDPRNEATTLQIWKAHFKNHKKRDRDKFKIEGFFEAFANGDGTDHLSGDVTVTLEGFDEKTIDARDLVREKKHFTYRGRSRHGWITRMTIRDDGRFKVVGKHLNLPEELGDAVEFSIAMEPDYYGEASITLDHKGRLRNKYKDKDDDDDDDDDDRYDDDDDDDDKDKKDDDDDDDDD